ncbi:amidohydrolase family protein [Kaistia geumhonensis]|uniref:L-fuconolactonase n=1 Tax=Kaistia geumhonensis TaxID=410839 RepID=A0ABU0MAD3_9HYPH|nr:amidohydrolase family protein [Kaistia geumhonensis]MCX5480868.1 amidohydrolase family protein [Kaistia geumhonensis]MDQ0517924.1 L-fuconolactonase [Kaistia geumhonensis]
MPTIPFVDTHVHLWDPMRLGYDWIAGNDTLDRRLELPEFAAASAALPLESMVFMECAVNAGQALDEARWVTGLARQEPRLKGIVAAAPLEQGEAVRSHLEALSELPLVRGVRRLLQSEADDFCLRPGFMDGVRMLSEFGFSFDVCIFHRQLANVIAFADRVESVPMILDHIGKPGIADGLVSPWAEEMRELARRPNVVCKISGVATEADHRNWTEDQLKRYVSIAIDAFGFDRVMFGGDWPVSTLAITYRRWIEILDDLLAGTSEDERRKFWRDNAVAFYRL